MRPLLLAALCAALAGAPATTRAQSPASAIVTASPAPAARAADVATLDGLVAAVYDVISGPKGQARDWQRMRSLFAPGARLIPTGKRADGTGVLRTWTLEEYIANAGPSLERDGFFERELGRKTERFGNIAHLFSAYDSRRTLTDATPFARGINSMQAWYDGTRWWIVTIYWQGETPDTPIPAEYLRRN